MFDTEASRQHGLPLFDKAYFQKADHISYKISLIFFTKYLLTWTCTFIGFGLVSELEALLIKLIGADNTHSWGLSFALVKGHLHVQLI